MSKGNCAEQSMGDCLRTLMEDLYLHRLIEGCYSLTSHQGGELAEAASVCLESQKHGLKTSLDVVGFKKCELKLHRFDVTEQMRRGHNDEQEATERGAYGIAILLVKHLAQLTVVLRSRKKTGFDYWLGPIKIEDGNPFAEDENFLLKTARLEVSGILVGSESKIRTRVKQKLKQITPTDGTGLPGYIVVMEYSSPTAHVEVKQ